MTPSPNLFEDIRPVDIKDESSGEKERSSNLKFDLMTFRFHNSDTSSVEMSGVVELFFNGGTVRSGSDEAEVVGSFPLFLGPGQHRSQDLDSEAQALAQNQLNQWLSEVGVAEGSPIWTKTQKAQIPLKTALLLPGIKLENGSELLMINLLQLALEDAFEQYKVEEANFDQLMDAGSIFVSICLGEAYDEQLASKSTFPNFEIVVSLCVKLRAVFEKRGLDACKHVIIDLVEYIEAHFWELDQWWNDCPSHKLRPKTFYFMRKEKTHGLKAIIELLCFLDSVVVTPKVRRDPLFELMKRQLAKVCVTAEAVLSLRKVIEVKDSDNCVLLRMRKKTLAQAIQRTLTQIRETIQDFDAFETQLNIKFEGTKSLEGFQRFCLIAKGLVDAQIQYLLESKVYGNFDVVVQLTLEKWSGEVKGQIQK